MSSPSGGSSASFERVLNDLCLDGKDRIVHLLQNHQCIKPARLVCHALRQAIDGSLLTVEVKLTSAHGKRYAEGGVRFPLVQWPRLTQLHIIFEDYSPVGSQLVLPLLGQPSASLQRINKLMLTGGNLSTTSMGWLTALIYRLPGLRELSLMLSIPREPLRHRLLYDALASLPQLEALHLKQPLMVPCVVELGARLKCLTVKHDLTGWSAEDSCPLVAQMQVLESAVLEFFAWNVLEFLALNGNGAALAQLLRNPPPRLQSLTVVLRDFARNVWWRLKVESGHIVEVHLEDDGTLTAVAQFAQEVLLPALDQPLRLLNLQYLDNDIDWDSTRHVPRVYEEELQQIRLLTKRCSVVRVGDLSWHSRPLDTSKLTMIMSLLGKPNTLELRWTEFYPWMSFDLRSPASAVEATVSSQVTPGMSRPELLAWALDRVMQRLDATANGASSGLAGPLPPTGWSTGVHLVQLRSPFFAALAWEPAALRAWLNRLARDAAARQKETENSSRDTGMWPPFRACLPVQSAGALLLESHTPHDALATEAAARAALAAGGAGYLGDGAVQIFVIPAARDLPTQLEQAGQELWDSGAGGSEEERLRLLLELAGAIEDESPILKMSDVLTTGQSDG